MSTHEPNLDMLSAYVDGVLSPDAHRSMEQHLKRCQVCADAERREQGFVARLDRLSEVAPPPDFVNAVMGRVAQYPAHRPGAAIPWREAMRWSVAASVTLLALFTGAVAWLIGSGALDSVQTGTVVAAGVGGIADVAASSVSTTRAVLAQGRVLLEEAGQIVWRISSLAMGSSWLVQATLLLLTVSLNYAFTRLVLNYQRRH